MIFSSALNFLIIITFIGYSYLFKLIILPKSVDKNFYNSDILYGIFLLIFISIILNFFFPLKYFFIPTILLGVTLFLLCLKRRNLKVNLLFYFLLTFFLVFISYRHGDNVDSPMYHLQIIKWISEEKIVTGLTNLEIRFGSNSLWFYLISLFQLKLNNFNTIYIFNFIPLVILFYETINEKKSLSYVYLVISVSFLIFFSYLHPFSNGVILNHLRNPELDISGMTFFILSFYFFLKCLEAKDIERLRLLVLSSVICVFIKISYIGIVFFPITILIFYFKKNIFDFIKQKLSLFVFFFILIWLLKNILISSCLLFPVSLTCFETSWSVGNEQIEQYSKIIKSYARDTPERSKYSNFDYTINSFQWFIPWLKEYAFKNALLQISFFLASASIILLYLLKCVGKLDKIKKKNYYYLGSILLIINLLIWFQAPETRFGWGLFITISSFPLSILVFYNNQFKKLIFKYIQYQLLIFILLISFDNKSNFSFENLITLREKNFDYSKIVKFENYLGKDFYFSKDWKCYDFNEICVNIPKENYILFEKNGYLVFLNSK